MTTIPPPRALAAWAMLALYLIGVVVTLTAALPLWLGVTLLAVGGCGFLAVILTSTPRR